MKYVLLLFDYIFAATHRNSPNIPGEKYIDVCNDREKNG